MSIETVKVYQIKWCIRISIDDSPLSEETELWETAKARDERAKELISLAERLGIRGYLRYVFNDYYIRRTVFKDVGTT